MDKETLSVIIEKYLNGKATLAEKQFLEAYYEEFDSGKPLESVLSENQINNLRDEIFNHIKLQVETPVVPINRYGQYKKYAAIAATLLVAVLVSLYFFRAENPGDGYKICDVKAGNVLKLKLSDGTVVWLNAKSKLRYPDSFANKAKREVYLDGEAYFEVKKDKAHPFMVHTQNLTTRVLGTKFNVKAYEHMSAIEVTLLEGKVMLTTDGRYGKIRKKPDTLYLKPNEKASFLRNSTPDSNLIVKERGPVNLKQSRTAAADSLAKGGILLYKHSVADAIEAPAWRNGEMVFNNEPLENVLASLNRKYNVVVKASPALISYPISARYTNESIDDVLIDLTDRIKRKVVKEGRVYQNNVQYKKAGSVYYIE